MNMEITAQQPKERVQTSLRRKRVGYVLLVVGILIAILPVTTSVWLSFLESYFVILGYILLPVGILMAYAGWLMLNPPTIDMKKPGDTKRWIGDFFLAFVWGYFATISWRGQNSPSGWFILGLFAYFLGFIVVRKLVLGYSVLESLGNLDAPAGAQRPRDEREAWVISKATQYTFGINLFLMFPMAALLAFAPKPSAFAICELFYAWLMVQIGIRHFFVWKLRG
jgi:hypothetical protein